MSDEMNEAIQEEAVPAIESQPKAKSRKKAAPAPAPAPVEKVEKSSGKEVLVGVDKTIRNVLELDTMGYDLLFESDIDRFKELPDDVVGELSTINKERYRLAYSYFQGEIRRQGAPKTKGLEIVGRLASATARLHIENPKPGTRYAWIAPHEMRARAYEGYKVNTDPDLDTFTGMGEGGTHKVGALGETELVLMDTPQENFDARQRAISQKSRDRNASYMERAVQDIRRAGGKEYVPPEGPSPGGPQFTPSGPARTRE